MRDVERLLDEYRAAWLAHDIDGIVAPVSDDVVCENLSSGVRVEGADAFARTWSRHTNAGRTSR